MQKLHCENYEEMSRRAAELVVQTVRENPSAVLGFATGSTPLGTYQEMIRLYEAGEVDFSGVTTFNLDEYYPISQEDQQSYYRFMWENLFSKINVNPERVHIPNGSAPDAEAECAHYTDAIRRAGGIDLQILGIGRNGHIGFNEPEEKLYADTHVTSLTQSTIEANARFFDTAQEVPRQALTMGLCDILYAKKILLLVSGPDKREALDAIASRRITTAVPATLLHLHPDCTLITA